MKRIVILGITGSIGTQTVAICKKLGFDIVGCSYHTNHLLAKKLIKENKIKNVYCSSNNKLFNCSSFDQLIKKTKPDMVVNAIIGFAGLDGTIATLNNKVDLALANKESCVVAGHLIFKYAKKHGIKIIPIDSEHTNLYKQLLEVDQKEVNQIYITCSGGKYFKKQKSVLKKVTYQEATTHKNWSMGQKITIDSNTLMNKCFEVIEAYWYFNTKRINVLLEPTSIIHSAVLLNDGTFSYSHSLPTMTLPICWAINNFKAPLAYLNKDKAEAITPVLKLINDIKPIKWAYDVINDKTHSLGIIINTANEIAIKLFKENKISFDEIIPFIEKVIITTKRVNIKAINQIKDLVNRINKSLLK